jgi:cytochrome c oxidase cbb3-type subunit 3
VVLQGRIVLPRGQGGYPGFEQPGPSSTRVTVTQPDGRTESGLLEFLSDYYVTLVDSTGRRITLPRDSDTPIIVLEDSLEAHLKLQERLTDRQMHDLTAYLASIR